MMNYKYTKYAWAALTIAVSMIVPQLARAGANEYSLTQNVNVALLRLPSASQSGATPTGTLPAPYIFDILNNRPDIKPSMWHLQNPLAPATVDSEINSRYGNAYSDNQQITPNMAPYWEVDLNTVYSAAQLRSFNLLVIRADGNQVIDMTATQRGIVRQYVDQGGTLWIDSNESKTFNSSVQGALAYDNIFRAEYGNAVGSQTTTNSYNPVANSPYAFNDTAIDALGYGGINASGTGSNCLTLLSSVTGNLPDPTLFTQISQSLYVGDYGSGHVVIDGQGIADWINLDGGPPSAYQQAWNAGQTYAVGAVVQDNGLLYHCIATNTGNEPDKDAYNPNLPPYHHTNWASTFNTPYDDPYDATIYSLASAQDLRFLVNVISYATDSQSSGANDRTSNAQAGNVAGALSTAWQYFEQSTSVVPSGIATYGKFVYTTDSAGNLSCFDVNPPESIFSDAAAGDDGATDYSNGTSYDLIWQATPTGSATPLSAPTVAQVPDGTSNLPVVMVEDTKGNVYAYPAVYDPGSAGTSPSMVFQTKGSPSGGTLASPPPAPTYYRGQLIAAEPTSTVGSGLVAAWSLLGQSYSSSTPIAFPSTNTQTSFTFPVGDGTWSQPVSVASIPYGSATAGEAIVGYAVSNSVVTAVQLGGRDEQLYAQTYNNTASSTSYSVYAGTVPSSADDVVFGAFEDTGLTVQPNNWILDYNTADNNGNVFNFAAQGNPTANSVSTTDPQQEALYGDYDLVPTQGTVPVRDIATAALADGSGSTSSSSPPIIQGAAVGSDNNIYITVNEPGGTIGSGYIEQITEANPFPEGTQGNGNTTVASVPWRFELNGTSTTPVTDASNIHYSFLGDLFEGAPIVGNNGLVYAVATNKLTNAVDIFAFNANAQIGFTKPATGATSPTNQSAGGFAYSQIDEYGGTSTVTGTDGGQIANFATVSNSTLSPDLYAPGTILCTPTQNGTPDGTAIPATLSTAWNDAEPMLEWYTEIPNAEATSPPRQIGDYIYVGIDSTQGPFTIAVYSNPAAIGIQPDATTRLIANTFESGPVNGYTVNPVTDYRFLQAIPTRLGEVTLPPTATNKYIVTGGAPANGGVGGFEGLTYSKNLVADGNRIIEFDPSGNATWALDSTQEAAPTGSAISTSTNTLVTANAETSVPLNRPTTVTQLNSNDYLIADSGNNRCVHVDRSGNVLTQITDSQGNTMIPTVYNIGGPTYGLEISSFSDPLGLLPVGQPTTLNRPNSVVTWETYDYGSSYSAVVTAINIHYLIADTGNARILDLVDRYTNVSSTGGNLFELKSAADFHYLNWISRTSDVGGRRYAYNEASPVLQTATTSPAVYYPDDPGASNNDILTNQATGIIGVVGNKYIPMLDTTQASNLTQVDQDSPGSSILLFSYSSGQPFSSSVKNGLPFADINAAYYVPDNPNVSDLPTLIPFRGMNSAEATLDNPNTASLEQLVVADSDGVFFGEPSSTLEYPTYPNSATYYLDATYGPGKIGWSFTSYDYDQQVIAYDAQLNIIDPLQPAGTGHQDYSGSSFIPSSAIEVSGNNFLIANRGAAQNQNAPAAGGTPNGFGGNVFTIHASISATSAPTDTLDGPIFGKPANTGALSAPAFALPSN